MSRQTPTRRAGFHQPDDRRQLLEGRSRATCPGRPCVRGSPSSGRVDVPAAGDRGRRRSRRGRAPRCRRCSSPGEARRRAGPSASARSSSSPMASIDCARNPRLRRRQVDQVAGVGDDRRDAGPLDEPAEGANLFRWKRTAAPLAGVLREDLQRLASVDDRAFDRARQPARDRHVGAEREDDPGLSDAEG